MYKFWLFLTLVIFVGLASYVLEEVGIPLVPKLGDELNEGIKKDLHEVQKNSLFPKELENVHQVFVSDHRTKKSEIDWVKISSDHFPQKPGGNFDLQIEVFDDGPTVSPKTGSKALAEDLIILQFSLFEVKSRNKVWELSRSYKSSELSPKK